MTDSKKQLLPTTTTLQSRVRLFQATRRPVYLKDDTSVTVYGSVTVRGQLGQAHADLLEAMLFCAKDVATKEGFPTKLLVDMHQVKKHSNIKGGQVKQLIDELMAAVITIKPANGTYKFMKGHLIESVVESKLNASTINKLTKKERVLWAVTLGSSLMELIKQDFGLNRDPTAISDTNSGLCQAVARHMLTHDRNKSNGLKADTAIKAVCGDIDGCQLRNRRREFKKGNDYFNKIGMEIKNGSLNFIN